MPCGRVSVASNTPKWPRLVRSLSSSVSSRKEPALNEEKTHSSFYLPSLGNDGGIWMLATGVGVEFRPP